MGYEDLNDHNRLRDDSVLALAAEHQDVTGAKRARTRDQGHPLAGRQHTEPLRAGRAGVDRDGSLQAHSGRL